MTIQAYLNENPQAIDDINAINSIFESFGLQVDEVITGAQLVRYKLTLPLDVKSQGRIRRAAKDIEYALTSALRCDEVVYGKAQDYVYVEKKASFTAVPFEKYIWDVPKNGLYLLLGKDVDGHNMYTNLSKAPHILVAGTTGSGKSELLHTFIASLIFKRSESPCRLVIIDPKRAEYSVYKDRNGIDLITDMSQAVSKFNWLCQLMDYRYEILEKNKCKDIYELGDASMIPYVVVVDELKDLLMQDKNAEKYIVRIAQKARACGIHLILGTQSPRADVVTGLIKANIPTKIALHTTNQIESRIILDQNGAEHLFGKGDMLFLANGSFKPIRIQSAYICNKSKEALANGLSYEKHSTHAIDKHEMTREELTTHITSQSGWNPDEALSRYNISNTQPQHKHVGLIQGMINLLKVKPIMFRTDDYPPRI